jgi:hypothetical protein
MVPFDMLLLFSQPHISFTAHQTFKRGYDIILSHLKNPPSEDLQNFLGYCEAWAVSIEGHHDSEACSFNYLRQLLLIRCEILGDGRVPIPQHKDGFLRRD